MSSCKLVIKDEVNVKFENLELDININLIIGIYTHG